MAVRDLRLSADSPALVRQLARDGRRRVLSGAIPSTPTYAPATAAPGEPRYDHGLVGGERVRTLRLEPVATNSFTAGTWITNSATVSGSDATAFDGSGTSKAATATAAGGHVFANVSSALTNGATYSFSVYLRSDVPGTVGINVYNGSAHNRVLATVGPVWSRHNVSFVAGSTTYVYPLDTRLEGTLSEVEFSCVQIEPGNVPSSYVPTYGAPATRAADVASKALASGSVRLTWLDAALAEQTATVAHGGGAFTIPVGTGRRYLTVEHDAGSGFTTVLDFPAGDTLAAEGWGFARASAATYTARNPSSPTGWLSARAYDWRRVYPGGRLPSLTGSGTAQVMGADDTVSTSDPDPALHGLSFDAGDRMSSVTALGAAWTVLWRERVAGVTRVYAETSTGVQYVDGAAGAHGRTLPTPTVLQTAGGLSGRVLGAWASHDAVLAPADVAAESARLAAL